MKQPFLPAVTLALGLMSALPAAAFTMADCASVTWDDTLSEADQPDALPEFLLPPGGFDGPISCHISARPEDTPEVVMTQMLDPEYGIVARFFVDRVEVGFLRPNGTLETSAWCESNARNAPGNHDLEGFNCFMDVLLGLGTGFRFFHDAEGQFDGRVFTSLIEDDGIFLDYPDIGRLFSALSENRRGVFIQVPDADLSYLLTPGEPGRVYFMRSVGDTTDLLNALMEDNRSAVLMVEIPGTIAREELVDGSNLTLEFDAANPQYSRAIFRSHPNQPNSAVYYMMLLRDAILRHRGQL